MHWGKILVVLSLQIVLVCVLVPSSWMERVVDTENRWLDRQMGTETAAWVRRHAKAAYDVAIVRPGVLDGLYAFLTPTAAQKARSGELSDLGSRNVFPYVRDRLETLFLVVYQTFVRLVLVAAWAPFAALILLPAIIDGIVGWRIRRTTFGFPSPTINHYALLLLSGIGTLMGVAVFAPMPLPPLALPAAFASMAPALYLAVSHTSKRV